MAKQSFTTGQVLTAAQMTSLQQTAMGGGSPSTKTASYVLVAADAGTVVQMNSASATTVTVNTSLFAAGDSVQIQNIGAGVMTITAGTATVNSAGSLGVTQYDGGFLYFSSASSAIWFDYTQAGTTLPLTTKGDLFGYNTGNARVPIGTNGQVLTADSTQALGLKWATAGGAGSNFTLLNSGGTALTGAGTITVSGISGMNKLMLVFGDVGATSTGTTYLNVLLNGDTGANYYAYGIKSKAFSTYDPTMVTYHFGNGASSVRIATRNVSSGYYTGYFLVDGCNASGVKVFQNAGSGEAGGSNSQEAYTTGGYYNSSSTISSVSLNLSSNNFNAGTLFVYGSA
jgi:hypothetical protein